MWKGVTEREKKMAGEEEEEGGEEGERVIDRDNYYPFFSPSIYDPYLYHLLLCSSLLLFYRPIHPYDTHLNSLPSSSTFPKHLPFSNFFHSFQIFFHFTESVFSHHLGCVQKNSNQFYVCPCVQHSRHPLCCWCVVPVHAHAGSTYTLFLTVLGSFLGWAICFSSNCIVIVVFLSWLITFDFVLIILSCPNDTDHH